jgi:AP-4 complex subunit mu-1
MRMHHPTHLHPPAPATPSTHTHTSQHTGGVDFGLRARLTLTRPFGASLRGEVGPVNLKFTIPMYSVSRLNLKYLQILHGKDGGRAPDPQRWVRYVTSSNSYTFRT